MTTRFPRHSWWGPASSLLLLTHIYACTSQTKLEERNYLASFVKGRKGKSQELKCQQKRRSKKEVTFIEKVRTTAPLIKERKLASQNRPATEVNEVPSVTLLETVNNRRDCKVSTALPKVERKRPASSCHSNESQGLLVSTRPQTFR